MYFLQRIRYIWSNYRHIVILLGITLVLVAGTVLAFVFRGTDIAFGGLAVDVPLSEEGLHYLKEGYAQAGAFPENKVQLTQISLSAPGGVETDELDYGGAIYAMSMVANRQIDYFLLDETSLKIFLAQEMFLDLQTVFSAAQLEALGDTVIQAMPVDENDQPTQTGTYPVALDISGLSFTQHCICTNEPVYLCFVAGSLHQEQFLQFWEYLNAWEE